MIRNERQLGIARTQRSRLIASADAADTRTDKAAFEAVLEDLDDEIDEYIAIRDGIVEEFCLDDIDGIADALVKARIARRWTQERLARELDVKEQQVQRDEAGGYESATLTRIADTADALDFELSGVLHLRTALAADNDVAAGFDIILVDD